MPVKGITDRKRLPRVGVIRLGIKEISKRSGAEYPKQVDYFVVKPDASTSPDAALAFHEVYPLELCPGCQSDFKIGCEKCVRPNELDIIFPVDDEGLFADVNYKMYTGSWGLSCRGNGEWAMAKFDPAQDGPRPQPPEDDERPPDAYPQAGTWANVKSQSWVYRRIPCLAAQCPQQASEKPQCRTVMNLQIMLPRVRGIGVWQINTGSWNSIRNVLDSIEMIKAITGGRIRGLPLKLRLVPKDVVPTSTASGAGLAEGVGGTVKTKTVYVLEIALPDVTLPEMLLEAAKLPEHALLPAPELELVDEEEVPDDLFPQAVAEMTGETHLPAVEVGSVGPPEVNSNTKPATSTTVDDQPPDEPAEYNPPQGGLVLTLGDLLNRCHSEFGYDKATVLKVLKVGKPEDITVPFQQAYELVRDVAAATEAGR